MAFNFVVKTDVAYIKDQSGSKFIGDSGVYDVTIKFASINQSKEGFISIDFNVDYEGNDQTFYGLGIFNKDGSENFGAKIFNKLCILAGIQGKPATEVQTRTITTSQGTEDREFEVISDLCDFPVRIWVQRIYSKYNGEIKAKFDIKGFFDEDTGASAEELINGAEKGMQLVKVLEKYAHNVTYQDGLTADDIEDWKANKKTKSTPAPAANKPAINPFAKPATAFPTK